MADFEYSIFALSHSLTKKEAKKVSSFLKDMGTHHAILQLELFEALRLSRSNEEENLKSRLQSPELLKYLSYHKDKLKEHILTVLWTNEKGLIRQSQEISEAIDKCVILSHRGFGKKAIQELDKLVNKIDFNLFPELKLRAYSELLNLLRNTQDRLQSNILKDNTERTLSLIKGLETSTRLRLLSEKAFRLYAKYRRSGDAEIHVKLKNMLEDPLLSGPPTDAGFMAIHYYYAVLVFVNHVKGDRPKVIQTLEANYSELLKHPSIIEAHPHVYAGLVLNLLNLYLGEGQFEKFEELHHETANLRSNDRMHQAEIQSRLTNIWLLYLLNRKMNTKVYELDLKVARQISEYEKIVSANTLLNLMYNFGILWYASDEPQKASDWLKRIVSSKLKARFDLKGIAQILLTLLTLDRENPDYTQSAYSRVNRFYKLHRIENGMSKALLDFLTQFAKARSVNDEFVAIDMLSKNLKSLNTSGLEIIGIDEILLWTESRLTGTSIRSVWQAS